MPGVGRKGVLWKLAREGAMHTPLDQTPVHLLRASPTPSSGYLKAKTPQLQAAEAGLPSQLMFLSLNQRD